MGLFCAIIEFLLVSMNIGIKNVGVGSIILIFGGGILLIYGLTVVFIETAWMDEPVDNSKAQKAA